MANLSDLEKMARELKCPICLSLLKSAVSLCCNHVFCNSCIVESRVSGCPVCKVPFRRREVRPAPHMDNLVTVFKGMEAASGFNILTTQGAPSAKDPDDTKETKKTKSEMVEPGKLKRNASDNKLKQNKKATKQTLKRSPGLPRFPAKKRVHVTPCPTLETPQRPEKVHKSGNKAIELEAAQRPENVHKSGNKVIELESSKDNDKNKKVNLDEPQDSLFPPFFWMREKNNDEDDESFEKPSSQDTEKSTQRHDAPCFSDIKDSDDDECSIKTTTAVKSGDAQVFDSEMFEWTQRACSPELCLTPPSKKTTGRNKLEMIDDTECHEAAKIWIMPSNKVSSLKGVSDIISDRANENSKTRRTASTKKKALKKKGRLTRCSQIENSGTCIDTSSDISLDEISVELVKAGKVKSSCQKKKDAEQMELPSQGNRSRKGYNINDEVKAQACKELSPVKSNTGAILPQSTPSKFNGEIATNGQYYTRKRAADPALQSNRKQMKKSTSEIKCKVLGEVLPTKQTEKMQSCGYNTNVHQEVIQKKECKSTGKERRYKTTDVDLKNDTNEALPAPGEKSEHENVQTSMNCTDSSSFWRKRSLRTEFDNGDNILRKCDNPQSKNRCAFCQSSDDTEESGEMMHYVNGKPVASDYNGGGKVIHSHKHCTEWAPDVYFEDDVVVNLAIELTRSRRIKCSCCGMKGAALGCYDKSCRRSFHFTCAKLVPACRWDTENFVMLCPLHSSCKLPMEVSESQKKKEVRLRPKEQVQRKSISKADEEDASQMWIWPSGSPCKWVICCSALTAMEKGIIAEFTKLTNVSISKTWSPSVTHVIASTDANGACKRTLKFLMGILDGKWILSIEWIKACMQAMEPVNEEKFEIGVDAHGIRGGPLLGRMRVVNKEPKLFSSISFYLSGDFMPAYKGYLQDLISSAGGTLLQRKPITRDQDKLFDCSPKSMTVIVYSLEQPQKKKKCEESELIFNCRREEAEALADACGAKVVTNLWIIDSIAASKFQPFAC